MNPDLQHDPSPNDESLRFISTLTEMKDKFAGLAQRWQLLDESGRVPAAPSFSELFQQAAHAQDLSRDVFRLTGDFAASPHGTNDTALDHFARASTMSGHAASHLAETAEAGLRLAHSARPDDRRYLENRMVVDHATARAYLRRTSESLRDAAKELIPTRPAKEPTMPLDPTVREALLAAIPEAAARGRRTVREDWDGVCDGLCDENNQPLDERYDVGQSQRDAEAWDAFEPFLDHGLELLDQAEEDFLALHQDEANPDFETIARRRSQLSALREAVEGGREERAVWKHADTMILPDPPESPEFRRRAEVLRNAEVWDYAIAFAENADVLVEIDQATRARTGVGRPRTAQAEAARARSTTTAAPSPSPPDAEPSATQSCVPGRAPRLR
ncbi:hypothetical protein ACWGJ2_12535 [Streptomyces sp. NPDC054796]